MFWRTEKSRAPATNGRPDHPVCSMFIVPIEPVQLVITVAHQLDFTCCVTIILGTGFVFSVRCNDEQ